MVTMLLAAALNWVVPPDPYWRYVRWNDWIEAAHKAHSARTDAESADISRRLEALEFLIRDYGRMPGGHPGAKQLSAEIDWLLTDVKRLQAEQKLESEEWEQLLKRAKAFNKYPPPVPRKFDPTLLP